MFQDIFYIIPSIVCLVCAATFQLRQKNKTQKLALHVLYISAAYFFLYILLFTPGVDYRVLCYADVLAIPLSLSLLASLAVYIHSHMEKRFFSTAKMQWLYMPALVEGAIVAVLYYIVGVDQVAELFDAREEEQQQLSMLSEKLPAGFEGTELLGIFYLFDTVIANILTAAMSAVVIVVCLLAIKRDGYRFGGTARFFFRGEETTQVRATASSALLILITTLPLSLIGRTYIVQHPMVGCVISVLVSIEIFMLCHYETLSNFKSFTLYDATHVVAYTPAAKEELEEAREELEGGRRQPENLTSFRAIEKTTALVEEVKRMIDVDRVWLDANLKMGTLADKLNTNRNKLSVIMNQVYGKDFKTLIAERRIEEAQRIMTEEPTATMEYVAVNCGFHESTIFLHRFKDLVGMTPTEWKMRSLSVNG